MAVADIKKIFFLICVTCVVCLVILGLLLIWGGVQSEFAWRVGLTLGLFFVASSVMLTIAGRMDSK